MAVIVVKNSDVLPDIYREYSGLSTDSKPVENVGVNSLFLELDTGDVYYFDGVDWSEVGGSGDEPLL